MTPREVLTRSLTQHNGEYHEEARRLLIAHRRQLDALAEALLPRASLNEQEILEVTGLPSAPALEIRVLPVSDDGNRSASLPS